MSLQEQDKVCTTQHETVNCNTTIVSNWKSSELLMIFHVTQVLCFLKLIEQVVNCTHRHDGKLQQQQNLKSLDNQLFECQILGIRCLKLVPKSRKLVTICIESVF